MGLQTKVRVLTLAAVAGLASQAGATLFYDASVNRGHPSDSQPYYYNPGPSNAGQAEHILFDDITAASPFPNAFFNVRKVTIRVSQLGFAPAATITPYYAELVPNLTVSGGAGDGPNYDPSNIRTFAAPFALPANPLGSPRTVDIVFGTNTTNLFNPNGDPGAALGGVGGSTASTDSSYKSFALGFKFSTTDNKNGWTVASYEDNLDVLWDYNLNTLPTVSFSEFTYSSDPSGLIYGTQWAKIEGHVLSGVAGDATIDGQVDIDDLRRLAQNWLLPGDYTQGDFNFDDFVDHDDLGIIAQNWQVGTSGPLGPVLESLGLPGVVPEPATALALLPLALVGISCRRTRD